MRMFHEKSTMTHPPLLSSKQSWEPREEISFAIIL